MIWPESWSKYAWIFTWIVGPAVTLLLTTGYDLVTQTTALSPTTAMFFILVILASFVGGWPAGLVCCLWGIGYSYHLTGNVSRTAQVGLGMGISVLIIAIQAEIIKRKHQQVIINQAKADLVDSANGNINRLKDALKQLDDLGAGWEVLSDAARRGLIADIRNRLATMTLLVAGWHALAREKGLVEKEYRGD